jgi:hypothetical protein
MQLNGERSRLGCCSVRLAPNIGGVAITKPWAGFERLYEPRGAAHCAGGALPISNRMAAPKRPSLLVYNALGGSKFTSHPRPINKCLVFEFAKIMMAKPDGVPKKKNSRGRR